MTQQEKIIELCKDGAWHCQREFRDLFIWSPHKRRNDLKKRGYEFKDRSCEHGIKLSKDYRLVPKLSAEQWFEHEAGVNNRV